jgi:hypothetical protein
MPETYGAGAPDGQDPAEPLYPGQPAPYPDIDGLLGITEAREFTAPLCPLTRQTTLGYDLIDFADQIVGEPLLEWQKWLAIHALELLPNGNFRFRTIIVLVARQNGKSSFARVLTLYFLYILGVNLVLGTAQSLDIARVLWKQTISVAQRSMELCDEIQDVRKANGQEEFVVTGGGAYRIAATNENAGRSLSVDLLLCDELRQQKNWKGWGALSKTTMARPKAMIVGLSNAGDNESVVLNSLEESGRTGRDPSIGLFAWTADPVLAMDDPLGWQQANPAMGVTVSAAAIRSAMATDPPAVFRTEVLCQRVDAIDAAIDVPAWRNSKDPMGTMPKKRVVCALDVAPDGAHMTLVAAAFVPDGRIRVEVVASWKSTRDARQGTPDEPSLKAWLDKVAPTAVGYYPSGPSSAVGADLRAMATAEPGHQPPFTLVDITGNGVTEACQAFSDLVSGTTIIHSDDPLLDAHLTGSRKLPSGDGWRFARRGAGHVDAAYAAAGAVHVLRNLPPEKPALVPMAM